jgi:hypothetical protein
MPFPEPPSIISGFTLTGLEEAKMRLSPYCIISTTTEDRFGEADSFDEAVRLARSVASEVRPGDPVCIEHRGRVIRQLVLMPDGKVTEEEIR